MNALETARPAVAGRLRSGDRPALRARLRGAGFVAPLIVLTALFVALPIGQAVYYSFTKYDGLSPAKWVGLGNYRFLLEWDDLHRILVNNLVLVLGIGVWVALPFVLAVLIYGRRRAGLLRVLLFVPALLPPLIVGSIFHLLLADDGPVNSALRALGLGVLALHWLSDDKLVLVTAIFVIAWAVTGTGVLFYSAGLAAISQSYIEAAILDGARRHQLVWDIYRPALRPITRFWTLLLTVATVTTFFPWIYGLTQGGPGVASTTLDFEVYAAGIQSGRLGLGAAIAVVGVLLIVVLLLSQLAVARLRRAEEWTA